MTFPSRILMSLVSATIVSLTPWAGLRAEEPTTSAAVVKESELTLLRGLDKEVSFAFEELPLDEAAAFLSTQAGINLLVDGKALDEVGIGHNTPVTSRSDGISLRSALRLMLRQIDPTLTYAIHDEAILITTREAAEEKLRTVLYDIQDFIGAARAQPIPDQEIYHAHLYDFPLARLTDRRDVDALKELITATIEPDGWVEVGGPGSLEDTGGLLVCCQTQDVHNRIAATLKTVRAVRAAHAKQPGGEPSVLGASEAGVVAKQQQDAVLARNVSLNFEETPLDDVADALTKSVEFNVMLDTKPLDEIGIDSSTLVTVRVKDISFRSALRHMLRSIDRSLTYNFSNDALLITSREAAEENLVTMIYPVGDLVDDGDAATALTYDAIMELIVSTVEADSWDDVGGPGSTVEFAPCHAIVVSQSPEVHELVQLLLNKIREVRGGQHVVKPAAAAKTKTAIDKDPYVLMIYHFAGPNDEGTVPAGDKADRKLPAPELVAELVEKVIQPASWQAPDAAVHALPDRLVVRQRVSAHREIFELLRTLGVLQPSPPAGRGFF